MKRLALIAMLAACSHSGARDLKYGGLVTMVAGGLLVSAPALNGDPLGRGTTVGGVSLAIVGVAMAVAGVVVDPNNAGR
jgi:hypothetical protein